MIFDIKHAFRIVAALTLTTDARAVLAGLEPVVLPEPVDLDVPDFLPAGWADDRP
jgi:hypothetical protein